MVMHTHNTALQAKKFKLYQVSELNLTNKLSLWRMVGRLTSPFSTKIGYIGDKVLGGDLVPPG